MTFLNLTRPLDGDDMNTIWKYYGPWRAKILATKVARNRDSQKPTLQYRQLAAIQKVWKRLEELHRNKPENKERLTRSHSVCPYCRSTEK